MRQLAVEMTPKSLWPPWHPGNIKTLEAETIGNIREKLPMSILSINWECNYVHNNDRLKYGIPKVCVIITWTVHSKSTYNDFCH